MVADGEGLAETLAALDTQVYDRTEVLVAATAPLGLRHPATVLVASGDRATRLNEAVAAATGSFVLVLDAGDLVEPRCVSDLVACVLEGNDAAYGDEDTYDEDHEHDHGHLKPSAFGRETLYSYDVVGAPLLVARDLFVELGGYDATRTPVEGHDLALRLAEATERIGHVAGVLLSRPAATRPDPADATAATVAVVAAAFERRGVRATVTPGDVAPSVRYTIAPPEPTPGVAIVIPTRDRLDLLRACVSPRAPHELRPTTRS